MKIVIVTIQVNPDDYNLPDSDAGAIQICCDILNGYIPMPDNVTIKSGKTEKKFLPD